MVQRRDRVRVKPDRKTLMFFKDNLEVDSLGNVTLNGRLCTKRFGGEVKFLWGGRVYAESLLVWFLVTGDWPTEDVTHKNGIRTDNRFSNLRTRTSKLQEEAEEEGLEFIARTKGAENLYRFKCCGVTREIIPRVVKSGDFRCRVCNPSHLTEPSKIYLFLISYKGEDWLKLGYSNKPTLRANNYGLPEAATVKTLKVWSFSEGYTALKLEKRLHKELKHLRLNPYVMRKLHTESGHTECYDSSHVESIVARVNYLKGVLCSDCNKT